jgi:hypothetical protein
MPCADLLQWVSQSRKTGTLSIEGDPFNKKIYFQDGLIAAASSENPREFLGYYLVGWDFVTEKELQELLEMQNHHGTMLGELMVVIGTLNREDLQNILQVKTEESIYELFLWKEGDFRFLENIMPTKKLQPLNLPVEAVILEGVRRKDEWERLGEAIPDPTWIPKVIHAVDVKDLGQTEIGILREINGKNSIEVIALTNRIACFHVMMFIYQGLTHDLFEIRAPEDDSAPIPGFSKASWMVLFRKIEESLGQGNVLEAYQRLAEIREKYSDHDGVNDHVDLVQGKIEEAVTSLEMADSTVLELAIPKAELTSLSCSPQEGFLLSRINGSYSLGEILSMIPGSELENKLLLHGLIERGVLRQGGA